MRQSGPEDGMFTFGLGWIGTSDPHDGALRTAWGPGLPVDVSSDEALGRSVAELLHELPFGFAGVPIDVRSVRRAPRLDTVYVELDLPREGLGVWRGGVSARVKHGRLVALRSGASPRLPVAGAFRTAPDDAVRIAVDGVGGGVPSVPEALLLEHGEVLRQAWLVRVAVEAPPERWLVFVDGERGDVLEAFDEVARISGTAEAEHHERTPTGPLVVSPLPYAAVEATGELVFTDVSGAFEIGAAGPYTVDLGGSYVTVVDHSGDEALLVADGPDLSWTPDDAARAELDVYVALHRVKAWGELAAPDVDWVWDPIEAHVRENLSWCNAYFLGGAVHFFQQGWNCWDPAENADVAYHEWGHGLHFHGLLGGHFDLSLSEGAADTVAFLQTGDPVIAPDFFKDGSPMRDVTTLRRWPDDYGAYQHENGLIFGGAMWDLLGLLERHDGPEAGRAATEAIFTGLLKGGPDIEGSYVEALVADDDDGDLGNGTPHWCEISQAFGRHGLGPFTEGDWDLAVAHEPPGEVPAHEPVALAFTLDAWQPECVRLEFADSVLRWRADGGAWQELDADGVGRDVTAVVPGQAAGVEVEYALSVVLEDGTAFDGPEHAYLVVEAAEAPAEASSTTAPAGSAPPAEAAGCGCAAGGSGVPLLLPLLFRRRYLRVDNVGLQPSGTPSARSFRQASA